MKPTSGQFCNQYNWSVAVMTEKKDQKLGDEITQLITQYTQVETQCLYKMSV